MRRNRYKHTKVDGTEFTIKENYEGTDHSSIGRRLATDDDITSVTVEYDGTIIIHVRSDESWTLDEYVPAGWRVVDALFHESDGAHAHLDIKPK